VFGSLGLLAGELPPHHAACASQARGAPWPAHASPAWLHRHRGGLLDGDGAAGPQLKTHDLAFADRPPTAAGAILAYSYKGILMTLYSPYWRMPHGTQAPRHRALPPRRVDSFEHMRAQEIRALEKRTMLPKHSFHHQLAIVPQ